MLGYHIFKLHVKKNEIKNNNLLKLFLCYNCAGDRMKDFIILTDTRQQKEKHILNDFDNQGILHVRTTLPSADYMALRYNDQIGMYLDYSLLIDTKKDLVELAHNLCNKKEHERIKKEIIKAKNLGCKKFCFLIADDNIKNTNDIKSWKSKYTKVKGETLLKIMLTMSKKYDIIFTITKKENVGKKVIELLGGEKNV